MHIQHDERVMRFLREHENHDGASPPIAVFDCDGTIIRGDIGESLFYRQIEEFQFRVSPASVWPDHPRRRELDGLYHVLASLSPEKRNESEESVLFADFLLSWYFDQLAQGKVAKACTDIVMLYAGFTREEVRRMSAVAVAEEFSIPFGDHRVGSRQVPRGARYLQESIELIDALRARGFDIWVISGSSKWSVEPVFIRFGIPRDRIIGINLIERGGVLTPEPVHPVPIREDKVRALQIRDARRPLLVASDSRNDIPLLQYSAGLKVLVNSHAYQPDDFFRKAGVTRDDSWAVFALPTEIDF